MLENHKAFPSFSVNNLAQAKEFYEGTLKVETKASPMGLELHIPGIRNIFVYEKADHVPATFTILNFLVNNIDKTVDELTAAGIKFEHYEQEQMQTDAKGISRGGNEGPNIAWFKDPAGNFLSVIEDKTV